MLFHVEMTVNIPHDSSPEAVARLQAEEKSYCHKLQRDGKWLHIWRVVGRYANVSIFDAASNDELHELLRQLPLFPFMQITVTPLARHPSALDGDS